MAAVFPGRYTARSEDPFVVFLIGMRVNRILSFSKWIPVAKGMPPMIEELKEQPELGLLHAEFSCIDTVWRWCSIGEASSICTLTHTIGARSIFPRGRSSIGGSALMGR